MVAGIFLGLSFLLFLMEQWHMYRRYMQLEAAGMSVHSDDLSNTSKVLLGNLMGRRLSLKARHVDQLKGAADRARRRLSKRLSESDLQPRPEQKDGGRMAESFPPPPAPMGVRQASLLHHMSNKQKRRAKRHAHQAEHTKPTVVVKM